MLDSYFFIPGDNQKYLSKIDIINVDYIVIDLEDAVSLQSKDKAFDLVIALTPKSNHFIRIPFFEYIYSSKQIRQLIRLFNGRVVVPKLKDRTQINEIMGYLPEIDLTMIILVENPLCLINLNNILLKHSSKIHAIGFGSHDFCSITGIKHESQYLVNYVCQIVLYAKAYNINYIDGVNLDLNDFKEFRSECVLAFEMGASGKFLIHPTQVRQLKDAQYMTNEELEEVKNVYDKIKNIPDDSIEVYTINGKIYEKPHIKRIKILINKLKKSNI